MANGFFLGGVASGADTARARGQRDVALEQGQQQLGLGERRLTEDVRLREQALGLQERQVVNAEERQARLDATKAVEDDIKVIQELVEEGIKVGQGEKALRTANQLIDSSAARLGAAGINPGSLKERLSTLVTGRATPAEIATTEGQTRAQSQLSQAQTLTEGGIPETTAQTTAGIKAPTPARTSLITFRRPDGEFISVPATDTASIESELQRGSVETVRSLAATSAAGLDATRPTAGDVSEARENIRQGAAAVEELRKTKELFEKTPEAGGIAGTLIEKAAGFIEQLPFGAGEAATEAAGIDTEAVAEARSQARATISRLLRSITQETSGRFTDSERQLAERVQGTLRPEASESQIAGALNQSIKIVTDANIREIDRLRVAAGITARDLTTDEGIEKMGEILTSNGFTEQQALDALEGLMQRVGAN